MKKRVLKIVGFSLLGLVLFREAPGILTVLGGIIIIFAIALYSRVEE